MSVECELGKYATAYTAFVFWTISYYFGGYSWWLLPGCVFGLLPLLEMSSYLNEKLSCKVDAATIRDDIRFKILLWSWLPLQFIILEHACARISSGVSTIEWLPMMLSTGIVTSFGINVAHELIHRHDVIQKLMGQILLHHGVYGHFYITHIYGHHRQVATISDISTAKRGQLVYNFIYRSIIDGYGQAKRISDSFNGVNLFMMFNFVTAVALIGIIVEYGCGAMLFFVAQALVAVLILETIQYIEHYGLSAVHGDYGHNGSLMELECGHYELPALQSPEAFQPSL